MLYRFDPFRDLDVLQNQLQRVFGGGGAAVADAPVAAAWAPAVDVHEDEGGFILHAELPGLSNDDIQLQLENRTLTLSGERKAPEGNVEQGYRVRERSFGRFTRSFKLPTTIQSDKIGAGFKDGVLTVTLPKAEEVKPRLIQVDVA